METHFVSYSELKAYFEKEKLKKDLEENSAMGICSAADLLFITETYKKRTLKPRISIEKAFEKFQQGPVDSGQIFTAGLERERLSEAMFEKLTGGVELWETVATGELPPRYSITHLALKFTPNTWWSEKVFHEMCNEYGLDEE